MSGGGNVLPQFMPISFFRRVSRSCGYSEKGIYGNVTSVYLVFEVFQTKVADFCFCIVRRENRCSYDVPSGVSVAPLRSNEKGLFSERGALAFVKPCATTL